MFKNKIVTIGMAGVLSMSIGLAACGNKPAASSSSAADSAASSSVAADSSASEKAKEAAEAAKILYWEGTTSDGQSVVYSEDEQAKTAALAVIKADASDGTGWSGKAVSEDGKVTITDDLTSETVTLTVVDLASDFTALKVNIEGYGDVDMKPITQGEFEKEVEGIIDTAVTAAATEAANEAADALSKATFYWEGTLSNGSVVTYLPADAESKEASLTITSADGSDIKTWVGTAATDNGKTTITDSESKQTIVVTVVSSDDAAGTQKLNIDGYGEVEMKKVTGDDIAKQAEQFANEVEKEVKADETK